ncbi:MAG: hypothetical protein OEW08_03725 [Gammaproteobacteria bacterium]|nr:hypothetical protein [Gammaproteobacteria bacterium]
MSEVTSDRLYQLLPAVYRIRDAEQGYALRALMRVLEGEWVALEQDVAGLYDNWFIETCEEWVVPYIGDLLKAPGLHPGGVGSFSLRAYVANLLAYRRRKGTASVLEQVASDVSGWRARVVEFSRLLATAQSLNHVRRLPAGVTSVRNADAMALVGSAFENVAHNVDVRHVDASRGRYNIPNVGIFLWRLQSYEVEHATPCAHVSADGVRYLFHPLGLNVPLFNNPKSETEITHLAEEYNVPAPLRRRPLYRELEARRVALKQDLTPVPTYFGAQPPFEIFLNGAALPLPPERVCICDLSQWDREGWTAPAFPSDAKISALVDPELGRLAVTAADTTRVEVSYTYGFSADIGGGPYNQSDALTGLLENTKTIWWRGVSAQQGNPAGPVYATLVQAVSAWKDWSEHDTDQTGVITVMDSATYDEALMSDNQIEVHANNRLIIVAAQLRDTEIPGVGGSAKNPDSLAVKDPDLSWLLVAEGVRPCIRGNISIKGVSASTQTGGAAVYLRGFLIDGLVKVLCGDLGGLDIAHCTLVPANGGITINSSHIATNANAHLIVNVARSICGHIVAPAEINRLSIVDSIIDGAQTNGAVGVAISAATGAAGPDTQIVRTTVRGAVHVRTLILASDALFTAAVNVTRLQTGCVRYCYLPEGSRVPRRFRCQPDLALLSAAKKHTTALLEKESQHIIKRIRPMFTSLDYGDPGYAQLTQMCAVEVRSGAEDGSEMGAFSHLRQPQREANIRANFAEYLRFGLEAGIFYVN